MLVTKQPVLRRFWYPVIPLELLNDGPKPFTLLGENIVVWLDSQGEPAAVLDRCCHRTAKLSRGYVKNDCIVCSYHGWEYDRDGKLTRIPQAPHSAGTPKWSVPGFHCKARYGYAWVALDEPLQDIPDVEGAEEPGSRLIQEFYEVWNAASFRYIENVLDFAHFPYLHMQTFHDGADVNAVHEKIDHHEWGFTSVSFVPVAGADKMQQSLGLAGSATVRPTTRNYYVPFARTLIFTGPDENRHVIHSTATPIDDQHMMFVQFCVRRDTEEQAPAAELIAWDRKITLEDRAMVEATDYDVALDASDSAEMHTMTDRAGLLARRKLLELLTSHGEIESRRTPRTAPDALAKSTR
ncbi:MAG: ndmA 1 [Rhodospirillales bacterium]|jgi:phenylpropionate dioxygenase-like ring-hydroxylating dioxygenase large terminal subunit|nr:ndmA 1 [Rhodospirillales bacterium]